MSDDVGARLSDLAQLASLFNAKASDVEALISQIDGAVVSAHWVGRLADEFRERWSSSFKPNLVQLGSALTETSGYVARNRDSISAALNGA
jgi:hypothetical protein